MNLIKNVWIQKIRDESTEYFHISGILIIKIFEKYRKICRKLLNLCNKFFNIKYFFKVPLISGSARLEQLVPEKLCTHT